jgi:cytochrome c biogenesis protein CcdA
MELPLVVVLALGGLALADSLSLGTLGLPALMLAQPKVRVGAVLVYLAVIAAFYWGVGLLLRAGVLATLQVIPDQIPERVLDVAQLVVGVALFAISFLFDGPAARRRAKRRAGPSRWERWQNQLIGAKSRGRSVAVVALGAGLAEVATMVPYLAAVGILTANQVSVAGSAAILGGYCLIMVLPALILLLLRSAFARTVEPLLERVSGWFSRRGGDLIAWVLGVVGVLLALDAINRLTDSVAG